MTVPALHWIVGGASVRGAAHERRGTPNQDAIDWAPRETTARHFAAAVSDGHGAPRYTQSHIGSRIAVERVISVLEWFLDGDTSDESAAELPAQTLTAWREAVQRHVESEAGASGWVDLAEDKLLPYGATLVAAAASDQVAVVLQIGDGDLYLGYPDGRLERPLPDDEGLVGEQTYSLCSPDALHRFRVAVFRAATDAPLPNFVLLSTDGVSKSFADEAAYRQAVEHYKNAIMTAEPRAVLDPLPEWLAAVSRRGSGDDVTLCLAALRGG
jgi:serine/threonine protein phosphatase PrpC